MNTRKQLGGGSLLFFTLALLALVVRSDTAPLPNLEESLQQPNTALPQGTELGSNMKPSSDGFLKMGKPSVSIKSISPAHGPVSGDTRVLVRGGPFAQY